MPFAVVEGARIFYRAFGAPSGGPPVVLIHGATVDGATDWGAMAPVLGLGRHVIVPDCRGHGRSANPAGGYSFDTLARDVAGLIHALGFERAHVVGHSNGGNVALVTLVEHPEVVASCVIQAANAFVSPDLRDHEPHNFDPDRVDREDPGWRDEMIRLHGRWHGRQYWRELLRITGLEIISAPNYETRDLEGVDRPVLVVEGTNDRVNARSHHGEFIARNIRSAELWRPEGVGHTVHAACPTAWLARVEDFWTRRGTAARDGIWRLAHEAFRDRRRTVFEVSIAGWGSSERAEGVVLSAEQREAINQATADTGVQSDITVLETVAHPGRVVGGVVDVLSGPGPDGERLTQALFGERLSLLDVAGEYVRARLELDGYIGWLKRSMIAAEDAREFAVEEPATHRVCATIATTHTAPAGTILGRIPLGSEILPIDETLDWWAVRGLAGAVWWVLKAETRPAGEYPPTNNGLRRYERLVGIPYLWGGRTPWGFDCSGLSQALHAELGTRIPRDADQQWEAGAGVDGPPAPGDLLFFASPDGHDPGRPVHVAIALTATRYLHAWGAAGSVTVSDLDPSSDPYAPALAATFLGARRYGAAVPSGR